MKKIKDWLMLDKRYISIIKALLVALIPLFCCIVRCGMDHRGIGEVFLPASEWNDELFYYKQVESIVEYGFPQGFFGFNESRAAHLSFAAWSPVLVLPWIVWGFLFGWNLMSPVICNLLFLSLAFYLFVRLTNPSWRQVGFITLLACLFTPFSRFILSGMPEVLVFGELIVFYGLAINYVRKEKTYKLVLLFAGSVLMTLMRPYFLLLLLFPAFFFTRKKKWIGAGISVAVAGVTFAIYSLIKNNLGAAYFAPLYFTDWLDAFFTKGIFAGIKTTFGRIFANGKSSLAYAYEGWKSGLVVGAYFASYILIGCILLINIIANIRRFTRLPKGEEVSSEVAERAQDLKQRLVVECHLLFTFIAFYFAILLMYKITEGSRHLLAFIAAGFFIIALMESKMAKKVIVIGVSFFYFFFSMATDAYHYQVPFSNEELTNNLTYWSDRFETLEMKTENVPNYDNVVIWTFSDRRGDGELIPAKWQHLYVVPTGFGVSCCTYDYVIENFDRLQSRYISTLSDGEIDRLCKEAGYREIGRDADVVVYDRHTKTDL